MELAIEKQLATEFEIKLRKHKFLMNYKRNQRAK